MAFISDFCYISEVRYRCARAIEHVRVCVCVCVSTYVHAHMSVVKYICTCTYVCYNIYRYVHTRRKKFYFTKGLTQGSPLVTTLMIYFFKINEVITSYFFKLFFNMKIMKQSLRDFF